MKPSPELEAVTRRAWAAVQSGSVEALRNLISDDPSTRMILSGDAWWLTGADDIPLIVAERSVVIDAVRTEIDRLEAFESGDVGWAASIVTMYQASGETVTLRNTIVYEIQGGIWKAVQLHTSAGVPEEDVFGYEIAPGPAALIESLTQASIEAVRETAGVGGTVTLMFTDVVDSTKLSQELGDAEWTTRVQHHFQLVTAEVTAHGGTVVKTLGDGTMNSFSSAQKATSAAVAIQRAVEGTGLPVRIGIHTGDAVAVGGDYLGTAVNKAARVASAAGGGEILLSSTTSEMVDRHVFEFGPERLAELKGLEGTHRLIPVLSGRT